MKIIKNQQRNDSCRLVCNIPMPRSLYRESTKDYLNDQKREEIEEFIRRKMLLRLKNTDTKNDMARLQREE